MSNAARAELIAKRAARASADARVRTLMSAEATTAADPIAFADLEQDIEELRQRISALDVEIAELERTAECDGADGIS